MTNKTNRRKLRKVFLLFIVIFITAVVLVVETYAWFVGITTVNVDQFQVSVTSAQGLELSLNGNYWVSDNDALVISKQNIESTAAGNASQAYSGNTNKWPDDGLKPLSSAGFLDPSVGRLKFYDKSSLSATAGGYRLISSRVDNYSTSDDILVSEAEGYIVFDLFIRNGVEKQYVSYTYENIYLTSNSSVTVSGTNHGAANSVRIGFFEIGTIKASNGNVSNLKSYKICNSSSTPSGVSNLCNGARNNKSTVWNVWEPNHAVHTAPLVSYYNSMCKKRNSSTGAYLSSEACTALTTTTDKQTYYVMDEITSSDNVDIYDGADVNGYALTTSGGGTGAVDKLNTIDTYKTPANATSYTYDNQLLKLPGNSIVKMRVYIWLEGQDIDNYDIISSDTIRINFGFTKDRFNIGNT